MTARTSRPASGTPTWLDFWVSDRVGTATFFHGLLGHDEPSRGAEFPDYVISTLEGRYVFGIGPVLEDPRGGDTAAMYFATDDIDATLARAVALGAHVALEIQDIPDLGRMAMLTDPVGTTFGLWQGTVVIGYDAVDEPGFPCWQDCLTTDIDASVAFYRDLFGFTLEVMDDSTVALLGSNAHFTVAPASSGANTWLTYFLVEDLAAAIDRAEVLGGRVTTPPTDLPYGRYAHLTTPGGAPFGLYIGNEE